MTKLDELRKAAEASLRHTKPSLEAGDDYRAFTRAATPQTVALLLDCIEAAQELRRAFFHESDFDEKHKVRNRFDAALAKLEGAP